MEPESPTSIDSDTIVVDSGNDFAIWISSATSVSSKSDLSDSEEASNPADITATYPFQPSIFNASVHGKPAPAPDDPHNGFLGDSDSPESTGHFQTSLSTWVGRLSGNDDSDTESQTQSSSDTQLSEETSSDGESTDLNTWQETNSPQISSKKTASRRRNQSLASGSPQDNRFRRLSHSQKLECVCIPPLLVPRSKYHGWKHPLPVSNEGSALSKILQRISETSITAVSYYEILLDDFVIYRPEKKTRYPWQMLTLDNIVSNRESCKYRINGVLRSGEIAQYVEGVELDVNAISIDGFDDIDVHSVQDMVYVKTLLSARRRRNAKECWYRLGKPAAEYRDLHERFMWVANLAKHVIDFLDWRYRSTGENTMVHLDNFRCDFLVTLLEWHQGDIHFQRWMESYNCSDFRSQINRHREFIFNRAFNLKGHYLKHDLWSELMVRPGVSVVDKHIGPEDTLVTPYVQHCCKSMPWSYTLKSATMSEAVQKEHDCRATAMGFRIFHHSLSGMAGKVPKAAAMLEREALSKSILTIGAEEAQGRFAVVRLDNAGSRHMVRSYSYVYIQDVAKKRGRTELKVIFVYLPSETVCLDGYYPHGEELFLSDCCNCSAASPLLLADVIRLVGVTLGDERVGSDDYFVRQKYVYAEDAICRLKSSDFQCPCRRPIASRNARRAPDEEQKERLSGLGLFAGCGNLDIGLEQAGAIQFVAAVEIVETALKTYAANRLHGQDGLILDSVNPCLSRIFQGNADLPGIGAIQFICAGSPCKGFSTINPLRGDDKGMRNCSLVASTVSYIETYLPSYAVLENVDAMGSGVGNSCNQIIACLVGLGYQVRKMKLNSRDFGSAQNRVRLFIVAAAPNVPLPSKPNPTHFEETPFAKASVVSEGMPSVDNDDLICISHPDHIAGARQTPMLRELIRRVPRYPKGMSFLKSIREGYQAEAQLEWFRARPCFQKVSDHPAFTRLRPDGYIPTITTTPSPASGFGGGRIIHWDDHRTLTLLEVRRAQGFPDDEVIIGDLRQQWAQVGNAVNRQVAIALGQTIADSWFSSGSTTQSKVVVSIPEKASSQSTQPKKILTPSDESQNFAVYSSTGPMLLSQQIHQETGVSTTQGPDAIEQTMIKSQDLGPACAESNAVSDSDPTLEDGIKATPKPTASIHNFAPNKIFSDESRFIDDMIQNNPNSAALRFNHIHRREISTVERNPAGKSQPVRFLAERSIEVRTKSSSSSATAIEYGSAEHPIEIETEVSVSKRRRDESSEDEDEDDELRNWVGKRVRARINENGQDFGRFGFGS